MFVVSTVELLLDYSIICQGLGGVSRITLPKHQSHNRAFSDQRANGNEWNEGEGQRAAKLLEKIELASI